MGFEYELLTRLAEHLGLKLEIVVSGNLDNEFEVLNRGGCRFNCTWYDYYQTTKMGSRFYGISICNQTSISTAKA